MKVYIGGPMFCEPDILYNRHLRDLLLTHGFDVYCPNDNNIINDKTRTDITPESIYNTDVLELHSCNVFLCRIAIDCGTMWEAGYMDCLSKQDGNKYYGCIGITTDIRLKTLPNPAKVGINNQAMYLDQFIIGGLKNSLGVYFNETDLINELIRIKREREHE